MYSLWPPDPWLEEDEENSVGIDPHEVALPVIGLVVLPQRVRMPWQQGRRLDPTWLSLERLAP